MIDSRSDEERREALMEAVVVYRYYLSTQICVHHQDIRKYDSYNCITSYYLMMMMISILVLFLLFCEWYDNVVSCVLLLLLPFLADNLIG